MVTKRELKGLLKRFRDPPEMTMEQALASENPVFEIECRIRGEFEALTEAEQLFWAANYFMGDTLNGGLHQTLSNDTGYWTETVSTLVGRYCRADVIDVFSGLKLLFPGGVVPMGRDARNAELDAMERDGRMERLDELTSKLCELEVEFNRGLVQFASERRRDFRGLKGTQHDAV